MRKITSIIALLLCMQMGLFAQTFTATIDDTWNPADNGEQALASTNLASFTPAPVYSALPLPDGRIMVACGDNYNQNKVLGLARISANGRWDASFATPVNIESRTFNALALQPDGKIVAGGRVDFSFIAGLQANNLHRYNADGTYDDAFAQGTIDIEGAIKKILVLPNGKLLVSGSFTSFNGTAVGRIVRLLADGTVDASFAAGTGANNAIEDMLLLPDGKIMIGGSFTNYNNHATAVNRIACLNEDGSLNDGFSNMSGANGSVTSITSLPNNKLLVTGAFTIINGTARNRIAIVSETGVADAGFGEGKTLANDIVYKALALPDGSFAVAGQFSSFNSIDRKSHVRIDHTGNILAGYTVEPNGTTSGTITGMVLQANDKILLNGSFQFLQRVNFGGLARINTNGFIDATFNPNGGAGSCLNRFVNVMQPLADGRIMIGGLFSKYNGVPCHNIMRLTPDGLPDPIFEPGDEGPVGQVRALAVQPDNKTVIAGAFSRVDGIPTPGFARLLENGRIDPSFTPPTMNSHASADVVAIQLLADGRMYIGGEFEKIGSNTALRHIARLLPNGLPDPSFTPPVISNPSRVNVILPLADGRLLVGGQNMRLGDETAERPLFRLHADGSLDQTFNAGNAGFGINGNNRVLGILQTTNNQLIIWGDFTTYNGQNRRNLMRLNLDGSLVTPNPLAGLPANLIVPDYVVEQADGKLLVTGSFNYTLAGAGTYPNILRLLADGNLDKDFKTGTGFQTVNGATLDNFTTNMVDYSLLVGNKLLVCGAFTAFNGTLRSRIARINLGEMVTPVTWLDFTVKNHNGNALLQWATASEINNNGFEIQGSTDGANFVAIGFVHANTADGNSNLPQQYSFTCNGVSGNAYYRIKQIDKDGGIHYSVIRFLKDMKATGLVVVPNPVEKVARISFVAATESNSFMRCISTQGQVVQLQTISVRTGTNICNININGYPAGIYTLQLVDETGGILAMAKFIKN